MTNNLGANLDVTVHCKSKDDDLGAQLLNPSGTYEFRFVPSFEGITQFFCRMEWSRRFERREGKILSGYDGGSSERVFVVRLEKLGSRVVRRLEKLGSRVAAVAAARDGQIWSGGGS
ncbi:S-protein homolog 5-like [Fagus crenata]